MNSDLTFKIKCMFMFCGLITQMRDEMMACRSKTLKWIKKRVIQNLIGEVRRQQMGDMYITPKAENSK